MDEYQAREWLCTELPALRQAADAGRWTPRLLAALDRLRAGDAALDVAAALDPDAPDTSDAEVQRGSQDTEPYRIWGLAPKPVTGDYGCPDDWCPRRDARDAQGRPPMCALFQRPMRFTER
jgi:hypothetical protein